LYVGRQIIARIRQSCTLAHAYDRTMVAALPRNTDLADRFDQLADLSEILGEGSFRVAAYRRAATRIRDTASSVAELALQGKAKELPDIGKTIEAKIVEIAETGEMAALVKRRAEVPGEVASFMRLPGLGPKTAARIWRELGVTTLAELKEAAEGQRIRALSGLGAATEEKILKALAEGIGSSEPRRALLGKGLPVVREVVEALRSHPSAIDVSDAGSTRRRRETFRDLDVIATSTDPAALTAHFVSLPWVLEVVAHGDTKATVIDRGGFRLDLRVVPPECYGDLLQHFTGSKDHNIALREDAQRRGLSISEYGVTVVETGEVKTFRDEESLYAFLGYAYIPPELRENGGELEAARAGQLPDLVELADLRGEMHCHSTWSADGKATIEEMARAAAERGYEFLCLTDHSHYLRDGRIEEQWTEIDEVNRRLDAFRVLRGVEANINAKGVVDVPDDVLAHLDWVVASLHTSFDRNPTDRVLAAIDNPHVDCIGHLTGRRISRRRGADLDIERVIGRAVETGTALEINGQPDRLDMRDSHARLAGEAGVRIPVNTDAHSVASLSFAELGIGQARRAWLTREQVLNTRPWAEIEAGKR
jgi:DNA polymerase (family 10)